MTDFLQLCLSGMATGSIYALAGLGFTLLWQASGTINFAQGEFVMLPAFMMLGFSALGLPLVASFALTCAVATLVLGWGFKRAVVDPLLEGVLEAGFLDGAGRADLAGDLDTDAVAREEGSRGLLGAVAAGHPARVHDTSGSGPSTPRVGRKSR